MKINFKVLFFISMFSSLICASDMFKAIKKCDLKSLQKSLKRDPEKFKRRLNEIRHGETPLSVALKYSPDEDDQERYAPARFRKKLARIRNSKKIFELLLEQGADPNLGNEDQDAPLHLAVRNGQDWCAAALLRYGADPNGIRRNGYTPLHLAISTEHGWAASLLLQHGADPNVKTMLGATPLHLAVCEGKSWFVRILLKHGGDPNMKEWCGSTSLHLAVRYGFVGIAHLLLAAGADVNVQKEGGDTPLCEAISTSKLNRLRAFIIDDVVIVRFLLAAGADPNLNCPLSKAAAIGCIRIAKLLLAAGAEPNVIYEGHSPLYRAIKAGNPNIATFLLANGANPDIEDMGDIKNHELKLVFELFDGPLRDESKTYESRVREMFPTTAFYQSMLNQLSPCMSYTGMPAEIWYLIGQVSSQRELMALSLASKEIFEVLMPLALSRLPIHIAINLLTRDERRSLPLQILMYRTQDLIYIGPESKRIR